MRPTTYAACALAGAALAVSACALAVTTAGAAACALAHRRCAAEAAAAGRSAAHCATRPAPVLSTATGY
jgi:hypothetical protein